MRAQRGGGTSRAYIIRRLALAGRNDLVEAIEAGEVSAFAVAVELGWHRRPPILGTGSTNQARRRQYRLDALGLEDADWPPGADDLEPFGRP